MGIDPQALTIQLSNGMLVISLVYSLILTL